MKNCEQSNYLNQSFLYVTIKFLQFSTIRLFNSSGKILFYNKEYDEINYFNEKNGNKTRHLRYYIYLKNKLLRKN